MEIPVPDIFFLRPRSLLALSIFRAIRKAEYVRSIHVYDQDGMVRTIQQEFLLHPGCYSRISQPISFASFPDSASFDLKQLMIVHRNLQESDGWKCMLEFRSDCPSETIMVALLCPSRNGELESIPSLAHDLRLVEEAALSRQTSEPSPVSFYMVVTEPKYVSGFTVLNNGEHLDVSKNYSWPFPTLPRQPPDPFPEQLTEIPCLGTPDRTPQGLQSEILHEWGSDLELASPRISDTLELGSWRAGFADLNQAITNSSSPSSVSFVSQTAADSTLWSSSLLTLNSQESDLPVEEQTNSSSLLPSLKRDVGSGSLDFELGTPASLQISSITDEEEAQIDCFSLDCFGLYSPTYNLGGAGVTKDATRSLSSDESVGTDPPDQPAGQLLALTQTLPSDLSIQNSATSKASDVFLEKSISPATSSDIYWDGTDHAIFAGNGKPFLDLSYSSETSSEHNWTTGNRATRRCTQARMNSEGQSQHRGTTERITEITLDELSQYFYMPITLASKELKVGLTVLKKRCREFGIPRWPHRKIMSLHKLIDNIQVYFVFALEKPILLSTSPFEILLEVGCVGVFTHSLALARIYQHGNGSYGWSLLARIFDSRNFCLGKVYGIPTKLRPGHGR